MADIASIVVAAVAIIMAWVTSVRQIRITQQQAEIETISFKADWLRDLRAWAEEAIDVLSEAVYVCNPDFEIVGHEDTSMRRLTCLHRLSSLIDRGRFFLPNTEDESVGPKRPKAYRGYRHASLDYLVAAVQVLEGKKAEEIRTRETTETKLLVELKRGFVSAVHEILDPRQQNKEVITLIGRPQRGKDRPIEKLGLGKFLPKND